MVALQIYYKYYKYITIITNIQILQILPLGDVICEQPFSQKCFSLQISIYV